LQHLHGAREPLSHGFLVDAEAFGDDCVLEALEAELDRFSVGLWQRVDEQLHALLVFGGGCIHGRGGVIRGKGSGVVGRAKLIASDRVPASLLRGLLRQDRVREREELGPGGAPERVDLAHELQQPFLEQVLGVESEAQLALGREVLARHRAQPGEDPGQELGGWGLPQAAEFGL